MKKVLCVALCLAMALSMSVCFGANAEAEGEKIHLVYQTWNPGEDWFCASVEPDFEAKYPNIDVELVNVPYSDHIQKLKIDLATGQGPDVYSLQTGASLKEFRDFEVDLTPLAAEAWGEDWESIFVPFACEVTAEDGVYYGLPMGTSYAGTLWADLNYFEKYNLNVPTNLDELKAVCQTFRENGEYPLAIGAKDDWINLDMWMNIANDIDSEKLYSAIDGETPFTDAALVESFTIWKSLFDEGVFQDGALGSLKCFDLPYVLTKGGPNYATEFFSTYIYKQSFDLFNQGMASTVVVFMFAIAMVITLVQLRLYYRGGKDKELADA